MRTRIALVVAVPVAVITVSSFTQTASANSAPTTIAAHASPTDARHHTSGHAEAVAQGQPFDIGATLLIPRSSLIRAIATRRRTVHRSTAHTSKVLPASTSTVSSSSVPMHTVSTAAATIVAPAPVVTTSTAPTASTTTATPTATAPTTPTTAGPVDTVTPEERAEWEQVAMCEEGGDWQYEGGSYSGGLGISRANWDAYGGLEFAPDGASATEDQQIMVAERIQFTPPDEDGCSGW